MRICLCLILLAACTKPNPETCCVTDEQCAALGVDELRLCDVGQACGPGFTCVAAECETSAECTDPAAPVCSLGLCISTCRVDDDCADVEGRPICAADGVCVGCETNDQCPADAAICDSGTRACRGCERDSECESGICLEADGVCGTVAATVYVASPLGVDAGDCTRDAPCRTLEFAFGKASASRNVLRVEGTFALSSVFNINTSIYIDGTDTTTISINGAGPAVRVALGDVTITHVQISAGSGPAIEVASGTSARLFDIASGPLTVMNGSIDVSGSRFAGRITCTNGTAVVSTTTFRIPQPSNNSITSTNCQLTVRRSFFDNNGGSIVASGGLVAIENSIILESNGLTDSMNVRGVAPGSVVQFNTFVNTTPVPSDGVALGCDSTVAVVNNVFAYRSAHPMGPPDSPSLLCPSTFSLFDSDAVAAQTGGMGNVVADEATFFVDRGAGDFRPGANSPAREMSKPGSVTNIDFDGAPRPQPAGTEADVGAFEAP